jgi:hypothetical protein
MFDDPRYSALLDFSPKYLNWVPDYAEGTPLDSASGLGTRQENVITWLRAKGAPPNRKAHSLYPCKFLIYIQVLLFA